MKAIREAEERAQQEGMPFAPRRHSFRGVFLLQNIGNPQWFTQQILANAKNPQRKLEIRQIPGTSDLLVFGR